MERYTTAELEAMETISAGYTADLKVESEDEEGAYRVWLERGSRADGHPYDHTITIERFDGSRWSTAEQYDGGPPAPVFERFAVRIELGNDAMNTPADVASALRKLADRLESTGEYDHTIRDVNGNTVGESEAEE